MLQTTMTWLPGILISIAYALLLGFSPESGALPVTNDFRLVENNVLPLRAMWIPTIGGAFPQGSPPADQRRELRATLEAAVSLNIDTIFFQILPHGGAGYCGTRSQEVHPESSWDALEYLTQEAGALNIRVHAWMNLFRANKVNKMGTFWKINIVNYDRKHCHDYGDFVWADPSAREVQDHVMYDVIDLASRFDVAGFHIDDYYYPPHISGLEFPDDKLYMEYTLDNGTLSKDEWRRENIRVFMARLYSKVKSTEFNGVSRGPQLTFSLNTFGLYHCGSMTPDCGKRPSEYQVTPVSSKWPTSTTIIGDFLAPMAHWQLAEGGEGIEEVAEELLLDWRANEEPTRSLLTGDERYRLLNPTWDVFDLGETSGGRHKREDDSSDLSSQVSFQLFTDVGQQEALPLVEPYDHVNWTLTERSWLYVIIHGYFSNPEKAWIADLRTALLNVTESSWVVVVDWQTLADAAWYPTSRSRITVVADKVKVMLQGLMDHAGMTSDQVHCIGHSLGAHTCGLAGKTYYFGRISGLDPAGPEFSVSDPASRLSYKDAHFVDVIHTDVGLGELNFGMEEPIGDVDFYPNGGSWKQPGCWKPVCSHRRAPLYYVESLKDDCFNASYKCTKAEDLPTHCESKPNGNFYTKMGYYSATYNQTGIYYLQTGSEAPYCRGLAPRETLGLLLLTLCSVILLLIFGGSWIANNYRRGHRRKQAKLVEDLRNKRLSDTI